ncbi:MAG: hypothetical protein AAGF83_23760 [Cyanobacteria bacterium P01_G01_bin.67]
MVNAIAAGNSVIILGEAGARKKALWFEATSIDGEVSILDIAYGKAKLLSFLKNRYSKNEIDRY